MPTVSVSIAVVKGARAARLTRVQAVDCDLEPDLVARAPERK
jgi:hypothetical protein